MAEMNVARTRSCNQFRTDDPLPRDKADQSRRSKVHKRQERVPMNDLVTRLQAAEVSKRLLPELSRLFGVSWSAHELLFLVEHLHV